MAQLTDLQSMQNTEYGKALAVYLDQLLGQVHGKLESASSPEVYRLQGEAQALRRLRTLLFRDPSALQHEGGGSPY